MNKRGFTVLEIIMALVLVSLVVIITISYGPRIYSLIKDAIGLGTIKEDIPRINTGNKLTPTESAKQEFDRFVAFLNDLSSKSYTDLCIRNYYFDTSMIGSNFYIRFIDDGEIKLNLLEESDEITLKTNAVNFVPYGDLSSSVKIDQYFNNYDDYSKQYIISPSENLGISIAEGINILSTNLIIAVSKDNKWFLTNPNSFIRRNPTCSNS